MLLNLGEPGGFDIAPWADRVQLIDAEYDGAWELPVLGAVTAPTAVLIRPDGYVAWVGEGTDTGLRDALTTWFGTSSPQTGRDGRHGPRASHAQRLDRPDRMRSGPPRTCEGAFGACANG